MPPVLFYVWDTIKRFLDQAELAKQHPELFHNWTHEVPSKRPVPRARTCLVCLAFGTRAVSLHPSRKGNFVTRNIRKAFRYTRLGAGVIFLGAREGLRELSDIQ